MSLVLLFHYLMLNMFRVLIRPSSGVCDLFVELFHGLYCSGSMCVGVMLWLGWGGVVSGWVISWVVLFWFDVCWCYVVVRLGWCGIRMQAEACIRIPHHPSRLLEIGSLKFPLWQNVCRRTCIFYTWSKVQFKPLTTQSAANISAVLETWGLPDNCGWHCDPGVDPRLPGYQAVLIG